MKGYMRALASYGLWIRATAAIQLDHQPSVTVINHVNLAVRQAAEPTVGGVRVAAIVPTESGQIGINPPGAEPTPANIEGHTKYLTEENGSTKWIGVDPVNIAVTTTTSTKKGGEVAVATITKGVSASKNAAGGLDILLSPAVKAKLEAIAKEVTPCSAKRRRQSRNHNRRGGPSCGLADFVQRVGADSELQESFAEPLTDQVWNEIDEGYESGDPGLDGGWEGDGGEHFPGEDEGYFSDDGEGFFEGAEGAEGESTAETVVFSSEEEAVAIGEALSGGDAAANAAVWGGSTLTAGSFLARIWGHLRDGKGIPNANSIPKESIHKVTKTKTSTSTTSASSCPTGSPPECGDECNPTSVTIDNPKVTGLVNWVCSEGRTKGCTCDPKVEDRISVFDPNFHQAVLDAMEEIAEEPEEPKEPTIECPGGISNVPSEFFLDKTSKGFCEEVMKDLGAELLPTAYDIDGNKIPILKLANQKAAEAKRALLKRSPPENSDNYLDYQFFLSYSPEDGECLVPEEDLCRNAWEPLVKSNCGNNHGSAGNRMFIDASIDVGCGKFTWHVEKPAEPLPAPSLGNRDCHAEHSHYDVHDGQQDSWSLSGCRMFAAGKTMKAGDPEIYWHPVGFPGADTDYHQNYEISWIDGCQTSATEQSVEFPIEADQSISCASLMRENYLNCNNGGAGGSIDAGCLRYDFYATDQ
ncbi:hypothetical protein DL769_011025 [Monosporascus sp. CRB-8-3]|nr:hypothetical protein DL769_011025 [Monosporascus sp. CRB-8-3]